MRGRRPKKPETYSLEYVEDFSWPRTTQMVVDHSPQSNGQCPIGSKYDLPSSELDRREL